MAFNACNDRVRRRWLILFCLGFLLLLYSSVRLIRFDIGPYKPSKPVYIGMPSGLLSKDTLTHKHQ